MPICFQLFRKGEDKPTPLNKLDAELCQLLNKPVHPQLYVYGWFDYIGFQLASGKKYSEIDKLIREDMKLDIAEIGKIQNDVQKVLDLIAYKQERYGALLKILNHFREHYTPNSFYESSSMR